MAVAPVLVSVTVETGLQLESGATAKETKETAEATNAGARHTNVADEASLSACTYLPIQHTSKLVHAAPGSQEAGQEAGQGAGQKLSGIQQLPMGLLSRRQLRMRLSLRQLL